MSGSAGSSLSGLRLSTSQRRGACLGLDLSAASARMHRSAHRGPRAGMSPPCSPVCAPSAGFSRLNPSTQRGPRRCVSPCSGLNRLLAEGSDRRREGEVSPAVRTNRDRDFPGPARRSGWWRPERAEREGDSSTSLQKRH
ncbi:hypothetical protein H1C71_034841 [Ictidomys tridecemlineatus]|nr:hypothetical protein H1C71_034841 [Ictidomys tridecemlineatus]